MKGLSNGQVVTHSTSGCEHCCVLHSHTAPQDTTNRIWMAYCYTNSEVEALQGHHRASWSTYVSQQQQLGTSLLDSGILACSRCATSPLPLSRKRALLRWRPTVQV